MPTSFITPLDVTASRPARKTLLLTGASGVVGQALLRRLAGHSVICLVRRTPVRGPNVVSLRGDVTQPRLGLDRACFDDLARRVDAIVHAAAITDFAQPAESIQRANVEGVQHVLDLAAAARTPLYHVSTAFVHPSVQGYGERGAATYQHSKREAERLVRHSGLPAMIVRPSIVVGDSRTGEIAAFQGLHLIASLCLKGLLPVLPMPARGRLDCVPQDVVAGVIAHLIERGHSGGDCWVTAGESAPTVQDLLDLYATHIQRLTGRHIAVPRLVGRAVFERLMRAAPEQARHLRRVAAQALDLSMYCIDQPLPSSLPELERAHGLPAFPAVELTMQRNLDYWWAAMTRGRSGGPGNGEMSDGGPTGPTQVHAQDTANTQPQAHEQDTIGIGIGEERCIA